MTKKNKIKKPIKQAVSKKDAQRSFVKNLKERKERNGSKNLAGNSDLLESADDINNLRKSLIKEFSVIRKSDGLITGTNEVLRLLEKERLIAIFVFKDKGSSVVIKDTLLKLCKQTGVRLIWLEDKDRDSLGPEFPKSITYGIKKEPSTSLDNLRSLLEQFIKKTKKRKDDVNVDEDHKADIYLNEMKLPSTKEATNQILDISFYHTHEGHVLKKPTTNETGFLSLNKFSTDEKETDFLDYDSVVCSGVLSIK